MIEIKNRSLENIEKIPKQHDFVRGVNIGDVVDQDRFDPITLKPSAESAVIFGQKIHETVTIKSSVKCVLKTDIMLKLIKPLGFHVPNEEREVKQVKETFM